MFSILYENLSIRLWSEQRPTLNFLARLRRLVSATPWDANMDAEHKLKGRVSVDPWMMATTAHCQQYTGDGLAVSLPVHEQDGSGKTG